jgi:ABC-type polysaccharide/polyol phosphate export permease
MQTLRHEIIRCIQGIPLALHFAWGDTKARYRRSLLGPFWIVLGTAVGSVGLGILWSSLFKMDMHELLPVLTIGLILWQLISGVIVEAPLIYIRHAALIRNIPAPLLLFPMQTMLRFLINFAHNIVIIVLVLLIYPPHFSWIQLMVVPGLVLLVGNLLWIVLILAMLGARFRDLEPLIMHTMPMLFFLSPVLYRTSHVAVDTAAILWLNPFTYMITLVRDPLLGVLPSLTSYGVATAMMVAGWAMALSLFNRRRQRIAFWI